MEKVDSGTQDEGCQEEQCNTGEEETTVATESLQMRRTLSLVNVVAMLVAITGHVAVFITPGSIMEMSGSIVSTFVLWFLGTFFVYALALCFAEMGTMFQTAGGPYLYLTVTFGHMAGFLTAWGYIILISGPFIGFASKTAALYIVKSILPDTHCSTNGQETSTTVLAGWILITVLLLNCFCLKLMIRLQNLMTLCKMVAIAVIIVGGGYELATGTTENFEEPLEGSSTNPGHISLALLYVIFSNGGWQAVTALHGEIKHPERTIHLSVHLTFAMNTALIVLTYLSYIMVLDKRDIIETQAIAILFCQRLWSPLVPIISSLVAAASIGALNTALMGHSRVIYAAARKGDMPCIMGTLHPTHRTPMVALFTVVIYGLAMLYSGNTTQLMQFIGLYSLLMGLKVVLALLYLRYTQPDLPRPYKVPIVFPLLQVVVNLSLLIFVILQEPVWMSYGLLIYFAGIPIYLVCIKWKEKPKCIVLALGRLTRIMQKLFLQVPS